MNFDPDRFVEYIRTALDYREGLRDLYEAKCLNQGHQPQTFDYGNILFILLVTQSCESCYHLIHSLL